MTLLIKADCGLNLEPVSVIQRNRRLLLLEQSSSVWNKLLLTVSIGLSPKEKMFPHGLLPSASLFSPCCLASSEICFPHPFFLKASPSDICLAKTLKPML